MSRILLRLLHILRGAPPIVTGPCHCHCLPTLDFPELHPSHLGLRRGNLQRKQGSGSRRQEEGTGRTSSCPALSLTSWQLSGSLNPDPSVPEAERWLRPGGGRPRSIPHTLAAGCRPGPPESLAEEWDRPSGDQGRTRVTVPTCQLSRCTCTAARKCTPRPTRPRACQPPHRPDPGGSQAELHTAVTVSPPLWKPEWLSWQSQRSSDKPSPLPGDQGPFAILAAGFRYQLPPIQPTTSRL